MKTNTTSKAMYRIALLALSFLTVLSFEAGAQTSKKKSTKKAKKPAAAQAPSSADETPKSEKLDPPDLNVRPNALPGTAFQFPEYKEFTLSNGLHVYLIENHEQPTLTFSLAIRGGDAYDPTGKEGTAAIAGDMLGKGTKSRTAQMIAETLDGVGAGISVSTAGESMTINASFLKRHTNTVLSILSEQLREPTFDEEELKKLKQQYQASVQSRRSRGMEIATALSRKVIYGMDNPLARRTSEKTIESVTREDVVTFHRDYIRPNSASIAIVGDITEKEARDLLKKYFTSWEKGTRPEVDFPKMTTEPAGVYFVPRKGSVQSTIIVSAAGPAVSSPDYDATDIMVSYVGGGFGSMLFNTLRETYSYTYSPFSTLTRGRRYNRIALGSEVRNAVTDSAITVIYRELRKLAGEGPEEAALKRRIASVVGGYQIAFERAGTVAAVLQNAWLSDISIDKVINHTSHIQALSEGDIQEAASRYLNMFNLRLIVVGSPDIRSKLEQFGPIKEFTLDLEPAKAAALEPVNLTAQQILDKYVEAVGGRAAVDSVKNVVIKGTVEMKMQGRDMNGTFERTVSAPNKEMSVMDLGVMKQSQWINGTSAWVSMMNGPAGEQSKDESAKLILEARIFPFATILSDGYTVTVKGKRDGMILLEATSPFGRADRYFIDEKTMLVARLEKDEQTQQGILTTTEKYEDYTTVGGVKLPGVTHIQNSIYSMTMRSSYSVNAPITDALFTPPTK
ncbi:MAG: insulinase family protein [Candidatus Kapabacteria bacterium]|nr:insulinase family protein [Candidatus Kapabacteria bacterium]